MSTWIERRGGGVEKWGKIVHVVYGRPLSIKMFVITKIQKVL